VSLIGLSGKKQSGKSTVAGHLIKEYGFRAMSFADPLREMLYALNPIAHVDHWGDEEFRVRQIVDAIGWDRAKEEYPEIRALMQRMGTEAGRNVLGGDVWVRELEARASEALDEGYDVVVPDVRFENEFEAIKALGGIVVRVNRDGLTPGEYADHISETALDDYRMDWTLHNKGTLTDLNYRTDFFMERMMGLVTA
jgi:hypothetical protein